MLFAHADTPVQLPVPDGAVVVGAGEEVVKVVEVEAVEVVGCSAGVVEVVVAVGVEGGVTGTGEPDTGQVFPRTAVIHEEPT